MRRMKRIAMAAAAVLLFSSLFLYVRVEAQEEEKVTIGISMASEIASYQKNLAGKMQEIAEQSDSYEVEFYYADWDADKQEKQLREMIDKQVDSIILCPVDAKSFLNVLREARDAGIPVVNLNMKLDPFSCEYITTYVGGSMSEEAVLAAELAVDYFGEEEGEIGIIEGFPGSDPQIYRTQAFLEEMNSHPNIEIVGIVDAKWSRSRAELAALDLLRKDPEIDMIYCHDCNMAMGAYDALKKEGKEEEVKVIGIGDALVYKDAVKEGKIYGIASQSADYEAAYGLICGERAARGKELRPWYKNPCEMLTSENIDKYCSPME
ncbi:MAG: sugar ABC transporter substrate-binding protein [Eubacteriales bacterium]|nr:sugar ABC transporter substrate-binding protein [Eubacteriales bacterium]